MNTSDNAHHLHGMMVDRIIHSGAARTAEVIAAFQAIPRHYFLPNVPIARVYEDDAIATHRDPRGAAISSSSQPSAMALMLEQLAIRPGHRVLEIGAGTGYNAALLARLAGPTGQVVTIDIDEMITAEAQAHLADVADADPTWTASTAPITVVTADGGQGYPVAAPFDRIILTVGAWDIAPAWIEQLAPHGILLLPLWLRGVQRTIAFTKPSPGEAGAVDGLLHSTSITGCSFMRLRGGFAGPEAFVALAVGGEDADPDWELALAVDDAASVDPPTVAGWFERTPMVRAVAEGSLSGSGWFGFSLWLALHDERTCVLSEAGRSQAPPPPYALPFDGFWLTVGLFQPEAGLAVLGRVTSASDSVSLALYGFGPAADALLDRLNAHVVAWNDAGRPGDAETRLVVMPIDHEVTPAPDTVVVRKRWHHYVVSRS